jgi:phosphoserine phosphatase
MKEPVIVFDFDKTLTEKDTLFGFYRSVYKEKWSFLFRRAVHLGAAFIYKLGIINNDQLKKIGVYLFLNRISVSELKIKAKDYISDVKLNQVYHHNFLNTPKQNRVIISASFEIYLKELFPEEVVVGSLLKIKKGMVVGLERNMFGSCKRNYLISIGINEIECLYTDSYSDLPIMEMSKKIFLVKNNEANEIYYDKTIEL